MTFAINVAADSQFAKDLYDALMRQSEFTIRVTEPYRERTFAKGDRVVIYGDNGRPLDAEILEVWDENVRVSYQGGRYTTALPRASIVTDHGVSHPAKLEVL